MEGSGPVRGTRRRGLAVRQLLLALAVIALLGAGGLDVVLRPGTATPTLAAASGGTPVTSGRLSATSVRVELPAPPAAAGARMALLAAAPGPPPAVDGPPPTAGPLVAAHLVAAPQSRPPTSEVSLAQGSRAGRGPPAQEGTDVSLPARP